MQGETLDPGKQKVNRPTASCSVTNRPVRKVTSRSELERPSGISRMLTSDRAFNIGEPINGQLQQPLPGPLRTHDGDFAGFFNACHTLCNRILMLLAKALEVISQEPVDLGIADLGRYRRIKAEASGSKAVMIQGKVLLGVCCDYCTSVGGSIANGEDN